MGIAVRWPAGKRPTDIGRQSEFSKEPIIGHLRQAEAGMRVPEICRNGRLQRRDAQQVALEVRRHRGVRRAQRPRVLEAENAKLRRLLTEVHLAIRALMSVLGVKPVQRLGAQSPEGAPLVGRRARAAAGGARR